MLLSYRSRTVVVRCLTWVSFRLQLVADSALLVIPYSILEAPMLLMTFNLDA